MGAACRRLSRQSQRERAGLRLAASPHRALRRLQRVVMERRTLGVGWQYVVAGLHDGALLRWPAAEPAVARRVRVRRGTRRQPALRRRQRRRRSSWRYLELGRRALARAPSGSCAARQALRGGDLRSGEPASVAVRGRGCGASGVRRFLGMGRQRLDEHLPKQHALCAPWRGDGVGRKGPSRDPLRRQRRWSRDRRLGVPAPGDAVRDQRRMSRRCVHRGLVFDGCGHDWRCGRRQLERGWRFERKWRFECGRRFTRGWRLERRWQFERRRQRERGGRRWRGKCRRHSGRRGWRRQWWHGHHRHRRWGERSWRDPRSERGHSNRRRRRSGG